MLTTEIVATRDTTVYSEPPPSGWDSNGAGDYLISGATGPANPGDLRRALLAFDIAAALPAGSAILSVTLNVSVSRAPPGAGDDLFSLFRATADWGEGTSDAGSPGGLGAPAQPGDATWVHTFFSNSFWTTEGGDFEGAESASRMIGDVGFYSFSSAQMVTDVQFWLDNPGQDFGWFLIGDEAGFQTARRFDSRDQLANEDGFPTLVVEYAAIPEPAAIVLWVTAAGCIIRYRRLREV